MLLPLVAAGCTYPQEPQDELTLQNATAIFTLALLVGIVFFKIFELVLNQPVCGLPRIR